MQTPPLTLFNTFSRKKEPFKPLGGQNGADRSLTARMYTCGPTVYNYLHVGNYRTYIFEDALKRTLKYLGYHVRHVMNITDVGHLTSQADEGEDKVEAQAAKEGKSARDIARFYEKTFLEDIAKLNIDFYPARDPKILDDICATGDILCRATEHIPEQIELIRRLEKADDPAKSLTYKISDGIYFDISRFPDYGRLLGANRQVELKAGARVEVNPEKHNPADFALWKFSPKGAKRQMEWDSPWGRGFPGWHIECSAMAMKYLGESFDIHCGGVDHIPIHHTNEIAQSEGATGKPFVQYWLHGEFLLMHKAKMAKSAGGFIRLQDLGEKGFDPLDFRYLCLTAHYRKQLEFSWESLDGAKSARHRLRERALTVRNFDPLGERATDRAATKWQEQLEKCMGDDLDMPGALAELWEAVKSGKLSPNAEHRLLSQADKVFGLDLFKEETAVALSPEQEQLLHQREEARLKKDFTKADALRKRLAEQGVLVEDTPQGQRWKRK